MPAARGIEFSPAIEAAREARGDLRIEWIDGEDLVRAKGIPGSVGGMEAHLVAVAETADHRTHPVGILERERGMLHQALHHGQRIRKPRGGLNGEPLVQY